MITLKLLLLIFKYFINESSHHAATKLCGDCLQKKFVMANVSQFDANRVMLELSKVAPFALIGCALLSFIGVGIFCVDYYEELLSPRFKDSAKQMAILIAVIQELVRFSLLIASIRDFSDSKAFNGWLGLLASIGLVMHDISIANDIAMMWSKKTPELYSGIFMFLIIIGLVLEIRLVLTVDKAKLGKPVAVREVENATKNGSYKRNGQPA